MIMITIMIMIKNNTLILKNMKFHKYSVKDNSNDKTSPVKKKKKKIFR